MAQYDVLCTAKKEVRLKWKCSYCGRDTEATDILAISGGGTGFYKQSRAAASTQAQKRLISSLDILSGKKGTFKDYRIMELNCKCSHCKEKEPWNYTPFLVINDLNVLKVYGCAFVLFPAFLVTAIVFAVSLGLSAGLVFFAVAIISGIRTYQVVRELAQRSQGKKKLNELPEESYPVLIKEPLSSSSEGKQ